MAGDVAAEGEGRQTFVILPVVPAEAGTPAGEEHRALHPPGASAFAGATAQTPLLAIRATSDPYGFGVTIR
jgi:hypothetical protein